MPRFAVSHFIPRSARLTGSAIGDEHSRQIGELLASAAPDDRLAVFDFTGVESASASYLKRILNPFFGNAEFGGGPETGFSPVLINVTAPDLTEDLEDYLAGKERALVVAADDGYALRFLRLLGRLDGAAAETFHELRRLKEATAQHLFELHPERTTNQTAWNNRLAQLVSLRVASRRREGRFWIYQPTVTT